jgi:hypothetical protein
MRVSGGRENDAIGMRKIEGERVEIAWLLLVVVLRLIPKPVLLSRYDFKRSRK